MCCKWIVVDCRLHCGEEHDEHWRVSAGRSGVCQRVPGRCEQTIFFIFETHFSLKLSFTNLSSPMIMLTQCQDDGGDDCSGGGGEPICTTVTEEKCETRYVGDDHHHRRHHHHRYRHHRLHCHQSIAAAVKFGLYWAIKSIGKNEQICTVWLWIERSKISIQNGQSGTAGGGQPSDLHNITWSSAFCRTILGAFWPTQFMPFVTQKWDLIMGPPYFLPSVGNGTPCPSLLSPHGETHVKNAHSELWPYLVTLECSFWVENITNKLLWLLLVGKLEPWCNLIVMQMFVWSKDRDETICVDTSLDGDGLAMAMEEKQCKHDGTHNLAPSWRWAGLGYTHTKWPPW